MKGPIFGVDYYPEQWPSSFWEADADRMWESGIRAVRLMEFAWTILEPSLGRFDFSLFDKVIDIFSGRGFEIVLGTPSAAVPDWLADKDIFQVHPKMGPREFGTRRQACLNSPEYRKASMRLVRACADHFAGTPGISGWQIDNELGHEGSDLCVCPHCAKAWQAWLEQRYNNLDRLNRIWGTVFWSTRYHKWERIPQPRPQVMSIHNPGLILDYYRFLSDTHVQFLNEQLAILRERGRPDWEITTNCFIPPNGHIIDLSRLYQNLDEVGFNNYPVWGGQARPIPAEFHTLAIQFFRGLKPGGNYTVFEQICGFQGHQELAYLPPPEQIVHWTNHVIAHGARRVFYFRWRTARAGQEQLCHGLIDPGREDTPHFRALRQAWKQSASDYARILNSTRKVQALLLWNKDECRILKDQWLSSGMRYDAGFVDAGYDVELANAAAALVTWNLGMDVHETRLVTEGQLDLSSYKIIVLSIKQLSDPALESALEAWVKDGGCLVLSYRSGTRTMENHAIDFPLPGPWSRMAGVRVTSFEGLGTESIGLRARGFLGRIFSAAGRFHSALRPAGGVWADYLEPLSKETRVLAAYTERWNRGKAAVTIRPWGRGQVAYIGTRLNPLAMAAVWPRIIRRAGLEAVFLGQGVEMIRREDAAGPFAVLLNHSGRRRSTPYGRLAPYQMKLLRLSRKKVAGGEPAS